MNAERNVKIEATACRARVASDCLYGSDCEIGIAEPPLKVLYLSSGRGLPASRLTNGICSLRALHWMLHADIRPVIVANREASGMTSTKQASADLDEEDGSRMRPA